MCQQPTGLRARTRRRAGPSAAGGGDGDPPRTPAPSGAAEGAAMALGRCGVPTAAPSATPQHRAPRGGHAGRGKCRLTPSVWFRRVSGRPGPRGFPPDARITGVPGPGAGSGSHAKVSGGVGLPPRGAAQGSPRLLRAAAVASGPVPEGSPVSPALGAQPGNHRGAGGGPQAPGQARPSGGAGTLEWRPRARASVLTPGSRLARSLGPSS